MIRLILGVLKQQTPHPPPLPHGSESTLTEKREGVREAVERNDGKNAWDDGLVR
jgi:hypothetical protein